MDIRPGDRVRIKDKDELYCHCEACEYLAGKTFKIKSLDSSLPGGLLIFLDQQDNRINVHYRDITFLGRSLLDDDLFQLEGELNCQI